MGSTLVMFDTGWWHITGVRIAGPKTFSGPAGNIPAFSVTYVLKKKEEKIEEIQSEMKMKIKLISIFIFEHLANNGIIM